MISDNRLYLINRISFLCANYLAGCDGGAQPGGQAGGAKPVKLDREELSSIAATNREWR